MIFHLCDEKEWIKALGTGTYAPISLGSEGFIHFSSYGQLFATANNLYSHFDKMVVLAVENNLLGPKHLKWEGLDGLEFPHVYKPLHIDDVFKVLAIAKNSDGKFISNKEIERWAKSICFETDRLILREFDLNDFNDVQEYAGDPANLEYMVWGPNSKIDTRRFFSRVFKWQAQDPRDEFHFVVVEKVTNKAIGACNLSVEDIDASTGNLGYIIRKDRQGKGYATELSKKLLDFGFSTLKLEKMEATCDERNLASYRVMEKIGLRKEMVLENDRTPNGKTRNTVICSVLRDKFFEN
jgi:RimJ/RimL family protein N-acetyltransferase